MTQVLQTNQTAIVLNANKQFLHTPPVIATAKAMRPRDPPKKNVVDRSNSPCYTPMSVRQYPSDQGKGGATVEHSDTEQQNESLTGNSQRKGTAHTVGILEEQLSHIIKHERVVEGETEKDDDSATKPAPPKKRVSPRNAKISFINYSEAISAAETIKNSLTKNQAEIKRLKHEKEQDMLKFSITVHHQDSREKSLEAGLQKDKGQRDDLNRK